MKAYSLFDCGSRIVRKGWRNFQGYPTIHAIGRLVDGQEEIGGLPQVLDCQFKEERLT